MPFIKYAEHGFYKKQLGWIDHANAILDEYAAQGYDLTLRQLYYQFVARDIIPNTMKSYKRLGELVNNARMAGLIDWDRILDRTRFLRGIASWDSPADVVNNAAEGYREDLWATQPYYVEVWIEKDALVGVFERICAELRLPLFSCRGYTSQSEMWSAAERIIDRENNGKMAIIFHFGDHDPSGIDMSRDIQDRLTIFGADAELFRLGLNMEEIKKYKPPPNPAKETDSRHASYHDKFGKDSWELDALTPTVLSALLRSAVKDLIDYPAWTAALAIETYRKESLRRASKHWPLIDELFAPLAAH